MLWRTPPKIDWVRELSDACITISLSLASILPLLIPLDAVRNIDMQGILLIVAGCFAWSGLALQNKPAYTQLPTPVLQLIAVVMGTGLISSFVSPHLSYNLLGAPYLRLGVLGLISCIGCALAALQLPPRRLVTMLYAGIVIFAFVSIPYSLIEFNTLHRVAGVFAQADVMACFMGCGFLLGLRIISWHPRYKKLLLMTQLQLLVLLALTQTRAVIVLVALLCIAWYVQHRRTLKPKQIATIGAGLLILAVSSYALPSRVTNISYASESVQYRFALQKSALSASVERPLFGYGPGNLADAIACSKLQSSSLQKTCQDGFFFNSSHNIFLDRFLTLGWTGGAAFLALACYALYKGLRSNKDIQVVGYTLLLISLYYLTNVTSLTLELLFWVLLIRCLYETSANRA